MGSAAADAHLDKPMRIDPFSSELFKLLFTRHKRAFSDMPWLESSWHFATKLFL